MSRIQKASDRMHTRMSRTVHPQKSSDRMHKECQEFVHPQKASEMDMDMRCKNVQRLLIHTQTLLTGSWRVVLSPYPHKAVSERPTTKSSSHFGGEGYFTIQIGIMICRQNFLCSSSTQHHHQSTQKKHIVKKKKHTRRRIACCNRIDDCECRSWTCTNVAVNDMIGIGLLTVQVATEF